MATEFWNALGSPLPFNPMLYETESREKLSFKESKLNTFTQIYCSFRGYHHSYLFRLLQNKLRGLWSFCCEEAKAVDDPANNVDPEHSHLCPSTPVPAFSFFFVIGFPGSPLISANILFRLMQFCSA